MLKINRPQYLLNLICRTAINHRFFSLIPPHDPLEVIVKGKIFHGSDVLTYFADEWGSTLFTPKTLGTILPGEIGINLGLSGLGRFDNNERARLLNDFENINPLMLEYFSDEELDIKEFGKYLQRYEAFSDPYGKKLHLIIKQGLKTGFWEETIGRREVPIDYHIIEMCVRTKRIAPNDYYINREIMPTRECFKMRKAARVALHKWEVEAGIDSYDLDDILWNISRVYFHQNNKCDINVVESILGEECKGPDGRIFFTGHWF